MTTRRVRRFSLLGRVLGGLVGLAALGFAIGTFVLRRGTVVLERLLHDFATRTVQERSDSIYFLNVGTIKFNWAARRLDVDSMVLVTNRAANRRRSDPFAELNATLRHCSVTGIGLRKLIMSKGVFARRFGCREVLLAVHVPRAAEGTRVARAAAAAADTVPSPSFLVMQQQLKLPSFAPAIHVRTIFFPHTSFTLTRERGDGSEARLRLEKLAWRIQRLVIDPDEPLAASRPLFSRSIDVAADNFVHRPDPNTLMRVGRLRVSLSDSSLDIRSISYGPTVSDAAFARQSPYRRTRVRIDVEHVAASGVDFGKLLRRGGIFARRLDVDTVDVDVWSDKRLPHNPRPRRRMTPQAWLATGPGAYGIDTLRVNGRIAYHERRAGHEREGRLTFERLRATAINVSHVPGRRTWRDPMTLRASAWLMNTGKLDATFIVPLDAPRFDMTFRGQLGPMPADSLNGFLDNVFHARVRGGQVAKIEFNARVRGGVATGTVTPYYSGFGIAITGKGANGILATEGGIGNAIRSVASFFANRTKVRANNPDRAGQPPRAGQIDHTFQPRETLVAYVWAGVRDALLEAVLR